MLERIFGTETEFGLYNEPGKHYDSNVMDTIVPTISGDNQFLFNGGRLYQESLSTESHGHGMMNFTPEYSTPECRSVRDLVCWEKAGEFILRSLLKSNSQFARAAKHGRDIVVDGISTNNSGHHENYSIFLESSEIQRIFFDTNIRNTQCLGAFLASRVIINGAGYFDQKAHLTPYKLSFRSDLIEKFMGTSTTHQRGIIDKSRISCATMPNTTNRRIHLIMGDHNMSEMAIYLTMGTTSLVLWMLEKEFLEDGPILIDPVHALHTFSGDPFLRSSTNLYEELPTTGLSYATAIDLQEYYCTKAKSFIESYEVSDEYYDIVNYWSDVIARLKDDIHNLNGELDWVTKFCLLESYLKSKNMSWLRLHTTGRKGSSLENMRQEITRGCSGLDLSYHFVDEEGIYNRLASGGKVRRILTDAEIIRAIYNPPTDTRAKIRGDFLRFLDEFNLGGSVDQEWSGFSVDLTGFKDRWQDKISFSVENPFDFESNLWENYKKDIMLLISKRRNSDA